MMKEGIPFRTLCQKRQRLVSSAMESEKEIEREREKEKEQEERVKYARLADILNSNMFFVKKLSQLVDQADYDNLSAALLSISSPANSTLSLIYAVIQCEFESNFRNPGSIMRGNCVASLDFLPNLFLLYHITFIFQHIRVHKLMSCAHLIL